MYENNAANTLAVSCGSHRQVPSREHLDRTAYTLHGVHPTPSMTHGIGRRHRATLPHPLQQPAAGVLIRQEPELDSDSYGDSTVGPSGSPGPAICCVRELGTEDVHMQCVHVYCHSGNMDRSFGLRVTTDVRGPSVQLQAFTTRRKLKTQAQDCTHR